MSEPWRTIVPAVLVISGLAAEVNLLRVFLVDWQMERGEERARRVRTLARRRRGGKLGDRSTPPRRIATPVLPIATILAGKALGQAGSEPMMVRGAEQPITISTNRPSFNDTAGIVPLGHLQLETGYTFRLRNRDGVETQTHNAPEVLARIALLEDRLELQLGTTGFVWTRSESGMGFGSAEGLSDTTIGVRAKLLDQQRWRPRVAVQASTSVGMGTDDISNQDVEPTFKIIWSYDLGDGWGLYGNLGAAYQTAVGDRFLQGQAGLCLTKALTDAWSVYGEYYVFGPSSKGTDAAHYFGAGVAYLVTPRLQWDARVAFGLNRQADNVLTGFGISVLF